ncbi:50S ribosomal protein L25/general stress protein Ctc [Metasolibacillus sp. FSL H7-0170]|uniref:50S ribosomal protein L25/general stress protein Ctc n=1 Tax=Metasolibacillus TaxID=2703677 RepID=UPI0007974179|nr:50S ribosomal protein L25/general stress protein Ctc [Metasolibacillus fluoroglycofenilyticus]KYG90945.1 50S ribosomal protein L25/general stress protein Ctc [[Bacillus] sp. KCTC 13219]
MSIVLQATKRKVGSQAILREIRKNGGVPAVVYGYQTETTPIFVDAKKVSKMIVGSGLNNIFKLAVDEQSMNAVISEVQRCALKNTITHVDFQAINMDYELEVDVPITLIGESSGVKEGGILMQPNLTVRIFVKPADIPESIEIDISHLTIGSSIAVVDIREQVNFKILSEDDYTLVTVMPPKVEDVTEEEVEQ